MIQILGLREFTDRETGEVRLYDAFYKNNWRAESVPELFQNLEKYLDAIPNDQHWNLFYTVANCTEKKRQFLKQDIIPIDIDGIEQGTEDQVVEAVLKELKLPADKVGIVYSGNGVHILIQSSKMLTDVSQLRACKPFYKGLVGRVNVALYAAGLQGTADPTVISEGRILRLPMTANIKPNKEPRQCRVINRNIEPLDVDVYSLADLPSVGEGEHIHPNAFLRLPDPDTKAVQEKCGFLVHCKENQEDVTEPQWYAMLSIIGRLDNGVALAHEYSQRYSKYNPVSTEYKVQHALESAGPRTCANISSMHEGCKTCPHYQKITSPIQLVGDDTIRSKVNGFYNIVIKDGEVKLGKPNYDDLVKYFAQSHKYVTIDATREVYYYTGTHWEPMELSRIHAFAEDNFRPTPSSTMCNEFEAKLKRTNLRPVEFLTVEGKINFPNGVLDIDQGTIEPSSDKYGFTYVLPQPFEPKGDCPVFKKFLREVTLEDEEMQTLLLEYLGYCISGTDPDLVQKYAILYGDGSNGKSVLLNLLRELVGSRNCSGIDMSGLKKDTYRSSLIGKLINISTETPHDSFLDSDVFKAMSSGEEVPTRRLYADPVMWKCTTKFIFACNNLPFSQDTSHGMFRRMIIIPFNATFSEEDGTKDPYILKKLLAERSDIIALLIQNFKNLRDRRYSFTKSSKVEEEVSQFKEVVDSVQRFVTQVCLTKRDNFLDNDTAYKCFTVWSEELRIKPLGYVSFVRKFNKEAMRHITPAVKYREPQGQRRRGMLHVAIDASGGSM